MEVFNVHFALKSLWKIQNSSEIFIKLALKLNEEGYNILKDELTKHIGPFSTTSNVMLALDLMAVGEDLVSTKVTKAHLANIIKVLCFKLKWNEDPMENEKNSIENTDEKIFIENTVEKNSIENTEEVHTNANSGEKNSEKIVNFTE